MKNKKGPQIISKFQVMTYPGLKPSIRALIFLLASNDKTLGAIEFYDDVTAVPLSYYDVTNDRVAMAFPTNALGGIIEQLNAGLTGAGGISLTWDDVNQTAEIKTKYIQNHRRK